MSIREDDLITDLKAELEQVEAHNAMLTKAADDIINAITYNNSYDDYRQQLDRLAECIVATSEQIESYKQELIAKAKEEQRNKSAIICYRLADNQNGEYEGDILRYAAEAIRNNKEQP